MKDSTNNAVLLKWIIDLRRQFHKYPELSFQEVNTQKTIISVLDSLGIENSKIADTGVLGIIEGSKPGKTVALRADMDALNINEEVSEINKSYISGNKGVMHACGHDGHMAMLLGAAKIVNNNKDKLKGRVKLIFQPAEELPPGGALKIIREGILDDVDSIIGMHLFTNINSGKICLKEEVMMASNCKFDIKITGKSGHHSNPEVCVDPILIASEFISTINAELKNQVPSSSEYVFGFGTVSGGEQFNQTPSEVNISGSYRVLGKADSLEVIENTIRKNLDGLITIHKTNNDEDLPKYDLEITYGYPALINTQKFTKRSATILKSIFPDVEENIKPVFASEDFARYLEKVPGTFIFLGAGSKQMGLVHGNHSNKFDIDENVLLQGAQVYYCLTRDFLNTPEEYISTS